jgi:hypothetical protein
MTKRWRFAAWGSAAILLLLPAVAMQFTDEVDWDLADFVFAATLIGGVGVAYELAAKRSSNGTYRAAVAVALAAAFVLLWGNLAVGVIGSEDNPANRMVAGVLAVGILGASAARLRPVGMSRAMVATALAQVLVAVIALVAGWGSAGTLTAFFVALWLLSAWLFRRASLPSTGEPS